MLTSTMDDSRVIEFFYHYQPCSLTRWKVRPGKVLSDQIHVLLRNMVSFLDVNLDINTGRSHDQIPLGQNDFMEDLINNQPVLVFLHISKNVTIAWISRRPLVSSFFCQNGLDFVTFHTVIAIYLTFTFVFRSCFLWCFVWATK